MVRSIALRVLAILLPSNAIPESEGSAVLSVCALSKDLPAFNSKLVTVRGVYYYGLRQADCPQKCDAGPWPSFFELAAATGVNWDALNKVLL